MTSSLNLKDIGVETDNKFGFIIGQNGEQTSVPHIYAIGDVLYVSSPKMRSEAILF